MRLEGTMWHGRSPAGGCGDIGDLVVCFGLELRATLRQRRLSVYGIAHSRVIFDGKVALLSRRG